MRPFFESDRTRLRSFGLLPSLVDKRVLRSLPSALHFSLVSGYRLKPLWSVNLHVCFAVDIDFRVGEAPLSSFVKLDAVDILIVEAQLLGRF